jgi:hypothetical protein
MLCQMKDEILNETTVISEISPQSDRHHQIARPQRCIHPNNVHTYDDRMMTPPTAFILPSHIHNISKWSTSSSPLLLVSDTPAELVTFGIAFAQHSLRNGRYVLITTQDRVSFASSLTSTLLTSTSSPLASASSILASDCITTYHVDTLAQLRVLLSTLQHSKMDFLGIDNFISLHEVAAELSAQGISRTLAAMINVTSLSKGVLVLRESRQSIERSVPILNSGVSGGLSHAIVPITSILGRWIRGFWYQESNGDGDCSAEWICKGEEWHIRWTLNDGQVNDVQEISTR